MDKINEIYRGHLNSEDSYLNSACIIINKLSKETGSLIDLHSRNIMVRMSPSPQLVLVDPLS